MVWAMVKPSEKINYTIFLIVMPLGLSVKLRCDTVCYDRHISMAIILEFL